MENLLPILREHYARTTNIIGDELYNSPKTLGIYDVLDAHYLIVDFFMREGEGSVVGGIGPKDFNLLHSTLGRQTTGYDGKLKWKDEFEISATLFYGLVKNHAFHDGNKRTALLSLLLHLWKLRRVPDITQKELEILSLRTAKNELNEYSRYGNFQKKGNTDIKFLAHFIRTNSRKIDKRNYTITYLELNTILKRFNYCLDNANGNHIDILQEKEKPSIFSFRRKKEFYTIKLGSIPFPGMRRQVCIRDLNYVRGLTNLTAKNGFDSDVFFRDAEPLYVLIDEYSNVFRRLANK